MFEFKNIFEHEYDWKVLNDKSTGFVSGIDGDGNKIFLSIKDSINKYLEHSIGSVIDFHLLKDTVNRHCDSIENDINVQTPLPLYCGLVGTMSGVIVGLIPLISTGALIYLLSGNIPEGSSKAQMDLFAAEGINELLRGVAWAMSASICGIFLTTLNSFLFKSMKLKEENGKNAFLTWMQSYLLPELPSDTSDALNKLVKNLNSFNRTFANNTAELKTAFDKVNSSYKIQAEVIKYVHDMDVMKMAEANVRVLRELQDSSSKLEQFNEYLSSVKGYTDTIHDFTVLFNSESDRLHVLEEIKEFFNRHKAEIAKDVTDSDVTLKDSLKLMKDSTNNSINLFKNELITQTESLKDILKQEKDSFEKLNKEIKGQFAEELSKTPTLIKNIEAIAKIPLELENLTKNIENSNKKLLQGIDNKITAISKIRTQGEDELPQIQPNQSLLPKWLSVFIVFALIVITAATITNTTYNIYTKEKQQRIQDSIQQSLSTPLIYTGDSLVFSKDQTPNIYIP